MVVARKTARRVEELRKADWTPSPETHADAQCEFRYRPDGWESAFRFVALRYDEDEEAEKKRKKPGKPEPVEQYQLFECGKVRYRVFVTNIEDQTVPEVTEFYSGRASAENLIKEANNHAGLAAHPSGRFDMNANHFQMTMPAYNLNCRLLLFQRNQEESAATLKHTMPATSRLRFSLCRGQDLETLRTNGDQLRRPLRGEGIVQPLDEQAARHCPAGSELRTGHPRRPGVKGLPSRL